MRLKTFTAPTLAEAMRRVREALGDEAIIVDSQDGQNGNCRITVAVETIEEDYGPPAVPPPEDDPVQVIEDALDRHMVPPGLAQRLLSVAMSADSERAVEVLRTALDSQFLFEPLGGRSVPHKPYMLVGPPGGGKTVAIAKMAAQAVLANRDVQIITTDLVRAGAVDQMRAYADLLKIDLRTADSPGALRETIRSCGERMLLIDSTSVNPFDPEDMASLRALLLNGAVEPVLTVPAGLNPLDAAETARTFQQLDCRRMIITRVDAARRLGDVLAAADTGPLKFALASDSPGIANPLLRLTPTAMARLLLPDQAAKTETELSEPSAQTGADPSLEPQPRFGAS